MKARAGSQVVGREWQAVALTATSATGRLTVAEGNPVAGGWWLWY